MYGARVAASPVMRAAAAPSLRVLRITLTPWSSSVASASCVAASVEASSTTTSSTGSWSEATASSTSPSQLKQGTMTATRTIGDDDAMPTRAVVLAGGEGTRLRPYTAVLPKPLMPVGDRPVLDIVLRQLRAAGVEHVTIATGYLAELIEAFCADGRAYGLKIDYFREREPLGTVGALATIDGLTEPFLVMNGDVLTDMSYEDFFTAHLVSDAAATIATTQRKIEVSLGVMLFE